MATIETTHFTLTAYAKGIDSELEAMFGKAMCAYANMRKLENNNELMIESGAVTKEQYDLALARYESEYEATIRCIDMFVGAGVYFLQRMVAEAVAEEFGL